MKKYVIQYKEKGKWKKYESVSSSTEAMYSHNRAIYSWNETRVMLNGKVINQYKYEKSPYYITTYIPKKKLRKVS